MLNIPYRLVVRVCIPGLPFPGNPGNGTASFPAKTETVQLTALLSLSVVAACSRDASSRLDWWVAAGCCHWSDLTRRCLAPRCTLQYQAEGGELLQRCRWLILYSSSDCALVNHLPQPSAVIHTAVQSGWPCWAHRPASPRSLAGLPHNRIGVKLLFLLYKDGGGGESVLGSWDTMYETS